MEGGRGQVSIAPGGCQQGVIFEDRRAVLVIVRIGALEEDQPARGGGKRSRILPRLQEREDLAGRHQWIAPDLREDLCDRVGACTCERRRLYAIDLGAARDAAAK
jgi:hypothetical protein